MSSSEMDSIYKTNKQIKNILKQMEDGYASRAMEPGGLLIGRWSICCGSKIGTQSGTLGSGNMDQNLRSPVRLILTHNHFRTPNMRFHVDRRVLEVDSPISKPDRRCFWVTGV